MHQFVIHHAEKEIVQHKIRALAIEAMNWKKMVLAYQHVQMAATTVNVLLLKSVPVVMDTFYSIRPAYQFAKSMCWFEEFIEFGFFFDFYT